MPKWMKNENSLPLQITKNNIQFHIPKMTKVDLHVNIYASKTNASNEVDKSRTETMAQ